jgi:trimeric autotransporter adhesin
VRHYLNILSKKAIRTSLALLMSAAPGVASQIALPSASAAAGSSTLVPLTFTSQQSSVSGIQFDLQFDDSTMSVGAILGDTAASAGKGLYAVNVAPNRKRILIIGQNQTALPDGTLVSLFINVSPTAPNSVYTLGLLNVAGSSPSAQPAPVTGTDGFLTVQAVDPSVHIHSSGVRSAASWQAGPVAPGEIITLLGPAIGPTSPQTPSGAASDNNLGATSVTFDGTPAPLLYAGPSQINAVVPYAVSGNAATQMQILFQGKSVGTLSLPVVPAVPAIFTLDSTGVGPGAILNQDMTVNSTNNPAARGSVISIFATGAGQTNPPGVDGQTTGSVLAQPLLAVGVQIGGLTSNVLYAGAAPGLISGVLQVNAVVPDEVTAGPSVPVLITIGSAASPSGVILAIR